VAPVCPAVGPEVALFVGPEVCPAVGLRVGVEVDPVGPAVGSLVDPEVGSAVGPEVGPEVGPWAGESAGLEFSVTVAQLGLFSTHSPSTRQEIDPV
jgi:hypothetical protein